MQAQRDELKALRDEVKKLRNAEDVDEEALQVAVDNLRSEHRLFREDVRAVIESNEELQASLQEARENHDFGDRSHRGGRPFRGGGEDQKPMHGPAWLAHYKVVGANPFLTTFSPNL